MQVLPELSYIASLTGVRVLAVCPADVRESLALSLLHLWTCEGAVNRMLRSPDFAAGTRARQVLLDRYGDAIDAMERHRDRYRGIPCWKD